MLNLYSKPLSSIMLVGHMLYITAAVLRGQYRILRPESHRSLKPVVQVQLVGIKQVWRSEPTARSSDAYAEELRGVGLLGQHRHHVEREESTDLAPGPGQDVRRGDGDLNRRGMVHHGQCNSYEEQRSAFHSTACSLLPVSRGRLKIPPSLVPNFQTWRICGARVDLLHT